MIIVRNWWKICIWLLGTVFLIALLTYFPFSLGQVSDRHAEILTQLTQANIIYLGETHDSPQDHQAQLTIIQNLQAKNPRIAIALEMFQRPYQPFLDRYLSQTIDETQLKEKTEYEERWGFDWEYYAPILRFAQQHQLPLLAINTPTEISRKVASQGLESLTSKEKRYIPPMSEILTDNQSYRQMLHESYLQHAQHGHGNSQGFERFFTTQVLWDETMAEAIVHFYQTHPNYQIIVLAGQGHIIYGYGIPSRVARRLKEKIQQRSVLFGDIKEIKTTENIAPADYIWKH